MAEEHVAVGQQPGVLRLLGRGGPFDASVGGDDGDLVADVIADEQTAAEGLRLEARLRALGPVAQGVTVVLHHGGHRGFPARGGVDADHLAEGHVAEAEIIRDDAVLRMAPAVDGFAVAFDVVSDDLVAVQVEVRLDGGELGLEVIVVTADIAQLTAEGRMAEQGAAALRIERAGELHRDVLGVERFARADLAAGEELTRVLAVHHHRAHGVGHRDALDEHVADTSMDEHAGVDVLHETAGLVIVGGIEIDGSLARDADAGDILRLAAVADADAVGLRGVVGHEPQAAGTVAGLIREADLHPVAEFLPIARDGDALVRGVEELAVAPRDGVRGAVLAARHSDRVDGAAEELGAIDFALLHVVGAADLEVVDLLA